MDMKALDQSAEGAKCVPETPSFGQKYAPMTTPDPDYVSATPILYDKHRPCILQTSGRAAYAMHMFI